MFLPIRSDRPLRSTPYVNYALIVVNVLMFLATTGQLDQANEYVNRQFQIELSGAQSGVESGAQPGARSAQQFPALDRRDDPGGFDEDAFWKNPQVQAALARAEQATGEKFWPYRMLLHVRGTVLWQFVTSQFLHSGPMHLIGNMIFLWVFGNNVEDRLGKLGYLFFYLSAGVLAGLAHWLTATMPALGASGAVAGVTGAFLALFPRTRIGFVYFWIIIGFFEVPALVVVLFFFAKDLLFYGMGVGNIAYTAHMGGTIAGFAVGMALLLTRLLPREPYDLLTMIEHKRRRDKFRKITRGGYQAWEGRQGGTGPAAPAQDPAVLETRQRITREAHDHDLAAAAARYATLLADHPDQVMSERLQADLANQLTRDGRHDAAAKAYALLLSAYPDHPDKGTYQLMLGLVYARYLNRPHDARPLLEQAAGRLTGEDRQHAQDLLASLPPKG